VLLLDCLHASNNPDCAQLKSKHKVAYFLYIKKENKEWHWWCSVKWSATRAYPFFQTDVSLCFFGKSQELILNLHRNTIIGKSTHQKVLGVADRNTVFIRRVCKFRIAICCFLCFRINMRKRKENKTPFKLWTSFQMLAKDDRAPSEELNKLPN
jgi:hypothetical protein